MARVTVEDCVDKVPNRFELVMLGAFRAREISTGGQITVGRDNDKNPVVALREIADEMQRPEDLRERLIESNQTEVEIDEPEDDVMARLMSVRRERGPREFRDAGNAPDDNPEDEDMLRRLMERHRPE